MSNPLEHFNPSLPTVKKRKCIVLCEHYFEKKLKGDAPFLLFLIVFQCVRLWDQSGKVQLFCSAVVISGVMMVEGTCLPVFVKGVVERPGVFKKVYGVILFIFSCVLS